MIYERIAIEHLKRVHNPPESIPELVRKQCVMMNAPESLLLRYDSDWMKYIGPALTWIGLALTKDASNK